MKRICCVTHHVFPENAPLRRDMETLVEAGYEVDIICSRTGGQKRRETIAGMNVYRLPVEHRRQGYLRYLVEYSLSFVFASLMVAFLHLRKRYAVIQVNNMPDFLVFTAVLPKLLGAKVVLFVFDNVPEYFAFNHRLGANHPAIKLLRLIERASAAYADHVLVTQSVAKQVLESHGVPGCKMTVVLNTPNEGIFHPAASTSDGKRYGSFRVMTHGEILYSYGNQTIIRAIPLLLDRIPGLEVQIAGHGEYLDQLVRLARDLGVEEHVQFTGRVPHHMIPGMIAEADVGVVPKIIDLMLPTKLMEYVAMAKPVIATAQPTMKAYFDDGSVMFYEPDNEHDLACCISELHSQPAKAASMVARASEFYERYRWRHMKHEYLSVYESLLA